MDFQRWSTLIQKNFSSDSALKIAEHRSLHKILMPKITTVQCLFILDSECHFLLIFIFFSNYKIIFFQFWLYMHILQDVGEGLAGSSQEDVFELPHYRITIKCPNCKKIVSIIKLLPDISPVV